jgi:polyisoprenoid-binding protein YceI
MNIWKLDTTHSEVQFKIKHLMISTVTGNFGEFDATLETSGDDFESSNISFSAKIDSISTGNSQRDEHLKSPDFFDAVNFPELTFKSTSLTKKGEDDYILKGDLTIRGVTKSVELDAEYGGTMIDFYGQEKIGFDLKGKINRKEFGLAWDALTEAGGVVVSDDVKLIINVQFAKQQ